MLLFRCKCEEKCRAVCNTDHMCNFEEWMENSNHAVMEDVGPTTKHGRDGCSTEVSEKWRAPESSNIFPEMVKAGTNNMDFMMLKEIMVGREELKEWVDAILILIPKKGNLTSCDN